MRTTIVIVASLVFLINCHTSLAQPGAPGGGAPLTCIVVGDLTSCSDLFPDPPEPVFCPGGTLCEEDEFGLQSCPVAWEIRNITSYNEIRPEGGLAGDEVPGIEGQVIKRICTAKRECTCYHDPTVDKHFCILGSVMTQIDLSHFSYASIPPNGGGACVGDVPD